jgi:hypothetical protein
MLRTATKPELELVPAATARVVEERDRMKQWLNERITLAATKPITEVVTLTPVLANLLLERNVDNRAISKVNLDRIKRDAIEGRFEFNGESLIVSSDGKLNNGQHRCLAVAESGHAIRVVMVFGVERETRMTLDQGVVRSVGHFLGMKGVQHGQIIGPMAGFAWQYEHGYPVGSHSGHNPFTPTKTEVLDYINAHPDMMDSVQFVAEQTIPKGIASKAMLAFSHYAIAHRLPKPDRMPADVFIQSLVSGEKLNKRDPILYLRNRLLDMREKRGVNKRAQLIFQTFNHWRRGSKIERLWVDDTKPLPFLVDA